MCFFTKGHNIHWPLFNHPLSIPLAYLSSFSLKLFLMFISICFVIRYTGFNQKHLWDHALGIFSWSLVVWAVCISEFIVKTQISIGMCNYFPVFNLITFISVNVSSSILYIYCWLCSATSGLELWYLQHLPCRTVLSILDFLCFHMNLKIVLSSSCEE